MGQREQTWRKCGLVLEQGLGVSNFQLSYIYIAVRLFCFLGQSLILLLLTLLLLFYYYLRWVSTRMGDHQGRPGAVNPGPFVGVDSNL